MRGEPAAKPRLAALSEGSIDAVVIDDDKPAIWELKTAKKRWSSDQIEFDLQTTAYKMGARVHSIDDPALELIITTKAKTPAVQREVVTRTKRDEPPVDPKVSRQRGEDSGVSASRESIIRDTGRVPRSPKT